LLKRCIVFSVVLHRRKRLILFGKIWQFYNIYVPLSADCKPFKEEKS